MVRAVRAGASVRAVAKRFEVSVSTVDLWVKRTAGQRLERANFSDRPPGCVVGWNRTHRAVERRILELRKVLREQSVLGEYGAEAIQNALTAEKAPMVPSRATINRALARNGAQDATRRQRRPSPPRGWYLAAVATGHAELDSFDLIEELKIANGPLVSVLTGTSVHGGLVDAWPLEQALAKLILQRLIERWERDGLPVYAQFDNGTQFQGAHQWPDSIGRISRLCLALGVIPVFAPPREHGFQNAIEGFNALWQGKVWQRYEVQDVRHLEKLSAAYVNAHRARNVRRREQAPNRRPFPKRFKLNLRAEPKGTMIFLRRSDEAAKVKVLGNSFTLPAHWPHRLTRCEVDLNAHRIAFFALRRRDPTDQPLLAQVTYHRKHKPFQGEL
jgi:transposase-like protein